MKDKVFGVILAAGTGSRMGFTKPKPYLKLAGKTVLEHTLDVFEKSDVVDEIIIVSNSDSRKITEEILMRTNYHKVSSIINGGSTRQESSHLALQAIHATEGTVIFHDAVRPFISTHLLKEMVKKLEKYVSVDVAIPAVDTIIEVDKGNCIKNFLPRSRLRRGQTPQGFKLSVIRQAHLNAIQENDTAFTDDCSLILHYKLGDTYVIPGSEKNIKITYPLDLYIADRIFQLHVSEVDALEEYYALKHKVIVVFGARQGIGQNIVQLCNSNGIKVYGTSRQMGCDIQNYESVAKFLDEVYQKEGRIDHIINTAAKMGYGRLVNRDVLDIGSEINTNYLGPIHIIKAGYPFLKESKGSLLLFTSSSYTRGRSFYSVYSSSKAAIVNLIQGLSEEFLSDEIRINAINPERTATPMRFNNFGKEPAALLLDPKNVAQKSLDVLCSDLTGQIIDVKNRLIENE